MSQGRPAELLSVDDTQKHLLSLVKAPDRIETVDTMYADGRILAEDVLSPVNVPGFDNSAMDGYAICVAADAVAPFTLPVVQRIAAGQTGQPLQPGQAARIFTGAPIPEGTTAVVMQEDTVAVDAGIEIQHTPKPGQHIRRIGEDISTGSVVVAAGTRLTPVELALIASVGIPAVQVYRPLRVATLFTGDELTMPGEPLPPGGIYNSNRFSITSLLRRLGCVVTDLGNVPDNREATIAALKDAAEDHDVVMTSGGVSVGEEDHVKAAVESLGSLALWRIAMKPGKPLAFGHIGQTAFVGLPGNPVSSYVTLAMLVRPFLLASMGCKDYMPLVLNVPAGFVWNKADKRREFLRGRLNANGRVELFKNQGSGVMTSLAWADGLVDVLPQTTVAEGDLVRFVPLSQLM